MVSIKQGINYLLHNRAQFCDSLVRNFLWFLPDKPYLSLRYRCRMGHWIDWQKPKTFTEKLQWLKVYDYKQKNDLYLKNSYNYIDKVVSSNGK